MVEVLIVEAKPIGLTTITLYPIADAYVDENHSDTNYGVGSLRVKFNSYRQYAYIMFNLSTIPSEATIFSATLKAYLSSISGSGSFGCISIGAYYSSDNAWTEEGITWNNKPAFNQYYTDVRSFCILVSPGYREWNVTEDAKTAFSGGRLTEVLKFASTSGHGSASFSSRDSGSKPMLIVEYTTEPIYDVHLESIQDTGYTSNLGYIILEDNSYLLPKNVSVVTGSYQASYEGGYDFIRWEAIGGVSVSDPNSQTTNIMVTGDGTLRAVGTAPYITEVWNATWGGTYGDKSYGVAVEGGYIYITGYTISFGAGGGDAFLAKYDVDGNQLWNRTWGGPDDDKGQGVVVDGNDIYITGYTESFGAGGMDAFLAKYDVDGNQVWNTTWGGIANDWGYGVAVDGNDIYITGKTWSFGAGCNDAFLAKYNVTGNQVWNTTWGGTNYDESYGIAVDGGYIYITGKTWSFGASYYDVFLAKYDNDNLLWNTTWGGTDEDIGRGVAVTDSEIYIVGETELFGDGSYNVFLMRYDVDGNQLRKTFWGGTEWDKGYGVAVNDDGIYITGETKSFGAGGTDTFLVRYQEITPSPTPTPTPSPTPSPSPSPAPTTTPTPTPTPSPTPSRTPTTTTTITTTTSYTTTQTTTTTTTKTTTTTVPTTQTTTETRTTTVPTTYTTTKTLPPTTTTIIYNTTTTLPPTTITATKTITTPTSTTITSTSTEFLTDTTTQTETYTTETTKTTTSTTTQHATETETTTETNIITQTETLHHTTTEQHYREGLWGLSGSLAQAIPFILLLTGLTIGLLFGFKRR